MMITATVTKTRTAQAAGSWINAYDAESLPAVVSDRGSAERPRLYREFENTAAALVEFPRLLDISVKMKGRTAAGAVAIRYELD